MAALYVALDTPSLAEARTLAERVKESVDGFKVGLELFVSEGPSAVVSFALLRPVFLDLKLHDIPETVERAVARACATGAKLLTVHASGGPAMLERAVERAAKENTGLRILAVTVLTSLDAGDLEAVGVSRDPASQALTLAKMARKHGVDGFVCSPKEVRALRDSLGDDVMLVTPGVRPAGGDASGDQKRTGTPEGAVAAGASAVVVGRPIRDAADPAAAAAAIKRALAK
ncbi:MAG TPA: orotidine-5'-phosphate decarboxylase [Polyangiaceae bacterium]|nr:orotidine-5'-phosphate decarboxylase [Polyangiaceae bacterium]